MSRVGLLGGLGPESTIDYYRRILDAWGRARPGSAPGLVIDSLDVPVVLRLLESMRSFSAARSCPCCCSPPELAGIPALDTTALHVDAIVAQLFSE